MTKTGDIAKTILIYCCICFVFIIIVLALTGQTIVAIFMLMGFLVPLSFLVHGYIGDKKAKKDSVSKSA